MVILLYTYHILGALSYVEFGNLEPKLCRKFTESVKAANSVYGMNAVKYYRVINR